MRDVSGREVEYQGNRYNRLYLKKIGLRNYGVGLYKQYHGVALGIQFWKDKALPEIDITLSLGIINIVFLLNQRL